MNSLYAAASTNNVSSPLRRKFGSALGGLKLQVLSSHMTNKDDDDEVFQMPQQRRRKAQSLHVISEFSVARFKKSNRESEKMHVCISDCRKFVLCSL